MSGLFWQEIIQADMQRSHQGAHVVDVRRALACLPVSDSLGRYSFGIEACLTKLFLCHAKHDSMVSDDLPYHLTVLFRHCFSSYFRAEICHLCPLLFAFNCNFNRTLCQGLFLDNSKTFLASDKLVRPERECSGRTLFIGPGWVRRWLRFQRDRHSAAISNR